MKVEDFVSSEQFARFVQQHDDQAEAKWQEEKADRNGARVEQAVKPRNEHNQEEDSGTHKLGRIDPQVARASLPRHLLKERAYVSLGGQQVANYLQEHEADERDRLADVEVLLIEGVVGGCRRRLRISAARVGRVRRREKVAERVDYLTGRQVGHRLHVDEEEGLREEGDNGAEEEVGLDHELPVDEVVALGARRLLQQIVLLLLHHERERRRYVREE